MSERWPQDKRGHCVGCGRLTDEPVDEFKDYIPMCEECLPKYDQWNEDSWIGQEPCDVIDCKKMIENGKTGLCHEHSRMLAEKKLVEAEYGLYRVIDNA